jgi:hypothetical protein
MRPGSIARLRREGGALLDTEAVLLVDDNQREIPELDTILQKRMRAHHDAGLTCDDIE